MHLPRLLVCVTLLITCSATLCPPEAAAGQAPPLIEAAQKGDVAEVERLFLQGQSLNQTTAEGRTALHVAAAAAQDKVVEWLIAHEANVFAKDRGGKTPADITTELGHRITSTLLKKFMLLLSIEQQASADESWSDLADALTRDSRHYTLLHVMAIRGNVEEAGSRILAGDAIDARTTLGFTPLMKAAGMGQAGVVSLLLKSGADVNARDLLDNTPLILAVVSGKEEVVRLLLDAGADLKARSRNGGGTALELAERMNRANMAVILRRAGRK